MRPPKSFRIDGHKWNVKVVRQIDTDGTPGVAYPQERTICLAADQSAEQMRWSFWHEYCHAWLFELGIARNDVGIPEMAEEMVCDSFADLMTLDKNVIFKRGKK